MKQSLCALLLAAALSAGCVDGLDEREAVASCPDMGDQASAFVATTFADDEPASAMGSAARGVAVVPGPIADPRWNDDPALAMDASLAVGAIEGAPIGGSGTTDDEPGAAPIPDEPEAEEPTTTDPGANAGSDPAAGGTGDAAGEGGDPGANGGGADAGGGQGPVETADPADQPDPIFETPYDASVDPLQAVPMSMVDMSKDFVWSPQFVWPEAMLNFTTTGLQPGEKVPDFTLWNMEGKQVKLSQYKGVSNVAIVLGSASCMVFRRESLSMWAALQQVAANATAKTGKKLEILIVFTKEAHPAAEPSVYLGTQWLGIENVEDKVLVSMSKTFAERVTLARGLDARFKLDKPNVWIDGMDDAVWKLFGSVPNGMFLIDMQGHLAWKELWAMHAGLGGGYGQTPDPDAKPTAFAMIEKLLGL